MQDEKTKEWATLMGRLLDAAEGREVLVSAELVAKILDVALEMTSVVGPEHRVVDLLGLMVSEIVQYDAQLDALPLERLQDLAQHYGITITATYTEQAGTITIEGRHPRGPRSVN